ncbi:MAG TPA: hypothetical protein VKS44_09375 [Candidatus Acidoferrales bacterium]|nr:hypothetical protein [Candidatus Acidoferrales bacterium]
MDTSVKGGTSYTYRVCTGAAKSDASNCLTTNPAVTVPVGPPPTPKPTVTLKAAATSIPQGSQTGLTWTSTDATELKLDPGHQNVAIPSGSTSVGPGTYTITATNAVGQATASVSIVTPCLTPWSPPGQVSVLVSSDIHLAWTNPSTNADQVCPAPSSKVLIYRMGSNGYEQLAALDKTANNGTLPTRYTDSGPFQPHTGYQYEICEGGSPNWQNPNNCASPHGVQHGAANYGTVTGGADPVLTATRVNANTVRLKLSLDQYTISSITVTRQGSDDPCRQGGTLGNGLQGCQTTKIGPGGVGVSPAQTVTVYNWNWTSSSQYPPGFQSTQTGPWVVNLPDDTAVKPGVEYYYIAHVVWEWSVAQDSQTVTAPKNAYASATQQTLAGGSIPIKQNGGAPPPQSGSKTAAGSMVSPTSRTVMPASSSSMMRPAGPTTAPPPQQSVTAARPMTAPMMTPAPPLLQPGRTMMSSTGASPPATTASRANLDAAIKEAQQKPHDAQAQYALGKAYCANNQKNTGVKYLNIALRLAEQAGNAPLAAQIRASLAEQGVSAR